MSLLRALARVEIWDFYQIFYDFTFKYCYLNTYNGGTNTIEENVDNESFSTLYIIYTLNI